MATPQFGERTLDAAYPDRPAAFGIAMRDGRIALVTVEKPGHTPWLDLPGGAIDPGESETQALVREFGEETGLRVRAGNFITRADQFFIRTDGAPFNNRGAMFEVLIDGVDAGPKIEADHTLMWLLPDEARRGLRHDAHAWAVAAWMRR